MRVSVTDAAQVLGVSPQFVRIGMQRGVLPIGSAVKMSSRWTYHISDYLLEQYAGKKIPTAATVGTPPIDENRQKGQMIW